MEESAKSKKLANVGSYTSMSTMQQRVQRLRQDVIKHVTDQFDEMVAEIMDGIDVAGKSEGDNDLRHEENEKLYCDKRKTSDDGSRLPEKQFLRRNSVLTDLYGNKHIRTIYNIFIVVLVVLFLKTVSHDLLYTGSTKFGVNLMILGFGKFSSVIETWVVMTAAAFCAYPASHCWAHGRSEIPPKSFALRFWDYSWIFIYVVYQFLFIGVAPYAIVAGELPPVSSVIILAEQIRMIMKTHAFVRTIAPIVVSHKPHVEHKTLDFPDFAKFRYFMFAPTLIYRDSYPRTTEIRWGFALWHLTEVVLGMFQMSFVFEQTLIPSFENFGKEPVELRSFVLTAFGYSFPGLLIFVSGFYVLLHAWMNAAAEVTRFGDRLFYKDWWTCTSYSTYYRRWNVVVHDWLYTYVYKDMYEIVTRGNRCISAFSVFFISAIFHEYIMAFTFGFFCPIMLCLFGVFGYLFTFLLRTNSQVGNTLMWLTLCMGSGLMISLYAIEFFARVNCPPYNEGLLDLFLPRTISCIYKHQQT